MIAHLQGREDALEAFGWTGRQAEWIALACLHSGVFTRAQLSVPIYASIELAALRFVHAMIAARLAADETVPGAGGSSACRICGRGIYRALGAEDIRHRRTASDEVLMRRLLSLDYVLEHTGLPWLPTEPEKVGAFEALGIERRLLPSRVYRGAAGNTRRYFPLKYSSMIVNIVPCGPIVFRKAGYYNVIRRIRAVFTGSLLCRDVPCCTMVSPSLCDTQVGHNRCVNDRLRLSSWHG